MKLTKGQVTKKLPPQTQTQTQPQPQPEEILLPPAEIIKVEKTGKATEAIIKSVVNDVTTPINAYPQYITRRLGEIFVKLDADGILEDWARRNTGQFLSLVGKLAGSFGDIVPRKAEDTPEAKMPLVIINNTMPGENRRQNHQKAITIDSIVAANQTTNAGPIDIDDFTNEDAQLD